MANKADGSLLFDTKLDESGFQSGVDGLGSIMSKALSGISAAFTGALAGGSIYAIKMGSDFESSMSSVAAISGASGDELLALEEKAKDLGATTKYSASEAANAMTNLASAGFTTNEILDAVPGLLNLASASGEDLATSTSIAASTLRGFGLDASDTAHVSDVLAETANRTNAAVADTGEAMKYVAPVAKAMGISFEETSAAIGIMSNAGIMGSQAGTTLRGALTRLVKPTGDMSEVMETLGLEFFDTEGNMKSLTDIVGELEVGTSDLSQQQKNQALTTLFGQEALSGMLALIDNGSANLDDLTKAFEECDGSSSSMAKTMDDNLNGKLTIVSSSLEGVGISAYEKFEEPLKDAVDVGIEKLDDLSYELSHGKLGDSMDVAADGISGIVEMLIDLGSEAIPFVIETSAFLCEHMGEATVVVSSLAAAWGYVSNAQKIHNGIATISATIQSAQCVASIALEAAQLALANGLGIAGAAQAALNAVMTLCPATWLMGAIVALGVAMAGLTILALNNKDEFGKQYDQLEENCEIFEELKEKQKEAAETAVLDMDATSELNEELKLLCDENGKVKEGYEERAEYIVNELNDALGLEMELVDGQIQGYQDLQKEIDLTISKKRAEAILATQTEAYEEAIKKKGEAQANLYHFEEELTKAREDLAKREQEAQEKGLEVGTQAYSEYMAGAISHYTIAEDAVKKSQQLVDDYDRTIVEYEAKQAALLSGNKEAIDAINSEVEKSYIKGCDSQEEALELEIRAQKDHIERLKKMKKEGSKWVSDKQIETAQKQLEQLEKDLEASRSTVEDKGTEVVEEFEEMMDDSSEKVGGKNTVDKFFESGRNVALGIKAGIEAVQSSVINAMGGLAEKMNEEYHRYNQIASPSKLYTKTTKWIPLGIAKGINDNASIATKAMNDLSDSMYDGYDVNSLNSLESIAKNSGSSILSRTMASNQIMNPSSSADMNDSMGINYKKLGDTLVQSMHQSDLKFNVDGRSFARLVKGVS